MSVTGELSRGGDLFGQETRGGRVVRWLLVVLGAAQFVLSYIAIRPFFRLDAYAAGNAGLPFQYRVLPMLVMRAFEHIGLLVRIGARMPIEAPSVYALVDAGLAFVGMLVAVWATYRTVLLLTGDRSVARWFPLLLLPMCHANLASSWGLNYTAPYDMPAVAFFAVSVWLIVSGKILWLYPVFALATLNRETSIFLVLLYAVWQWTRLREGEPGSKLALGVNCVALGAVWVAIKVVLGHIYLANAARGDMAFDSHLRQNLRQIVEPQQWPVLLSVCAFALPVLWLGRRWIRNRAYSRAMVVTMAAWICGMMIVGTILEIRIFAEWAALVVPALALMTRNWFAARTAA